MALRVTVAGATSRGLVREANEDSFGHVDRAAAGGPAGFLAVIADGMGGAAGGEVASRLAVDAIGEGYARARAGASEVTLAATFARANRAIHERAARQPDLRGMGTTCTAVVLEGDLGWVGHVGDSRAYRITGGGIERLTEDHSLAARGRAFAHVLTRALGVQPEVDVDITALVPPPRAGDMFLLCSDGLWGQVSADDMREAVERSRDLQAAGEELVALANRRGGPDNVTVVLARVDSTGEDGLMRRLGQRLRRARALLAGGASGAGRGLFLAVLLLPWALAACAQKTESVAPPAAAPSPAPAAATPSPAPPLDPDVHLVQGRPETAAALGYSPAHGVVLRVDAASVVPPVATTTSGGPVALRARLVALAPEEDARVVVRETWSILFAGIPLLTLPSRELALAQGTSEVERTIQLPADAADGEYSVELVLRPISGPGGEDVRREAPFAVARPAPGPEPGPPAAPQGPVPRVLAIRAESVDVRAAPGAGSRPRARILRGTPVEVLEERRQGREAWYHVRLPNGDDGWIPAGATGPAAGAGTR